MRGPSCLRVPHGISRTLHWACILLHPLVYCSIVPPPPPPRCHPEVFVSRHLACSLCLRVSFLGNSSELTSLHLTFESSCTSSFPNSSSRRKSILSTLSKQGQLLFAWLPILPWNQSCNCTTKSECTKCLVCFNKKR